MPSDRPPARRRAPAAPRRDRSSTTTSGRTARHPSTASRQPPGEGQMSVCSQASRRRHGARSDPRRRTRCIAGGPASGVGHIGPKGYPLSPSGVGANPYRHASVTASSRSFARIFFVALHRQGGDPESPISLGSSCPRPARARSRLARREASQADGRSGSRPARAPQDRRGRPSGRRISAAARWTTWRSSMFAWKFSLGLAAIAVATIAGSSSPVITMIFVWGHASRIHRAVSTPSTSGRSMSISTTSGGLATHP